MNIVQKWLRENGFTEDEIQKIIGFHWESFTLSQVKRALIPHRK